MTAVEWFASEIKGGQLITNQKFKDLLEQANGMFEKQIRQSYMSGADHVMDVQYNRTSYFNDEHYYNETFKTK